LSLKFCPKCGSELELEASFCYSCGEDLGIKDKYSESRQDTTVIMPISKPQISSTTVEYGSFVNRLIALIVDSIIIGGIGTLLSLVLFMSWIPFNIFNPFESGFWTLSFPFDWFIGFLYHWLMESYNNGQTVGKKLLKLRTVDEKTLGNASLRKYAINNIFKSSPFLILDLIVGVLKNSDDPKNRLRIMQKTSETVVIVSK
jgi:uncharacterized RDD family membrane protein YckC